MNVGQSGFVPTGRKQLANLRGGGFTGAGTATARSQRRQSAHRGAPGLRRPRAQLPEARARASLAAPNSRATAALPGTSRPRGTGGPERGRGSATPALSAGVARHVFFRCQRRGELCTNNSPTPTPPPAPRSPSWDDLGKGDCGGIGLKDCRLSEGKLPWWVASRLAAPSFGRGEPLALLETGGRCSKPEEDPGELATQIYSSFRTQLRHRPACLVKGSRSGEERHPDPASLVAPRGAVRRTRFHSFFS